MPTQSGCLVAAAILFGIAGTALGTPDVFVPQIDGTQPPAGETVRRARPISADAGVLLSMGQGDAVTLNLFADLSPDALIQRIDRNSEDSFTWSGTLLDAGGEADEGRFVLSYEQGAVMGAVWTQAGETFEVRSDQFGRLWAVELESKAFPPCETGAQHEVDAGDDVDPALLAGTPCPDDGSIIDVLVVYTPAARNAMGGTNSAIATANAAIAATNTAYTASLVNSQVRLVYVGEIAYNEGSGFSQDLSRFRGTDDGFMDNVHQLRDQYQADMVALLNDNSGACGIGYIMTTLSNDFASSAFTVTDWSCAVGNLTFPHELGHNQGCAHDHDNAGNALYSYSYGHRWNSTNGNQYRSVMSYSPGSRVPRMSNPNVLYIGAPTGVPSGQNDPAENARSINNAAFTIAGWRQSGELVGPMITTQPMDLELDEGDTAIFQAEAMGTDPMIFRWYKGNQPMIDGGRVSGAGTDQLVITSIEAGDDGSYYLRVNNACDTTDSVSASLTVNEISCTGDIADDFGSLGSDGMVSFGDFLSLLGLIGPCPGGTPGCIGDIADDFGTLNGGDGMVSFGDFLALLGLIGPCP